MQTPISLVACSSLVVSLSCLLTSTSESRSQESKPKPNTKVTPFLMFEGQAEEAMNFYVSLFEDGKVMTATRYGKDGPGKEGTIQLALFEIAGQKVMCIDSPAKHAFTFTPSFSLFVDCHSESQIDDLYKRLSKDGKPMMPLDNYGFSKKFGWIQDRFGVSWQLNLPGE